MNEIDTLKIIGIEFIVWAQNTKQENGYCLPLCYFFYKSKAVLKENIVQLLF